MVHQYGSSEDYDKIAEITGDAGWSWDSVKRNIGKVLFSNLPIAIFPQRQILA